MDLKERAFTAFFDLTLITTRALSFRTLYRYTCTSKINKLEIKDKKTLAKITIKLVYSCLITYI